MDSIIKPIPTVVNSNSFPQSKKEDNPKEAPEQTDNTGKMLAGLVALGALGGAIFLIAQKGKPSSDVAQKAEKVSSETLQKSYEQFVAKFRGKYDEELTPHMAEIEKMINHSDDKTRIKAIISLNDNYPSQALKEKMIYGLMKKSENAPDLDREKHYFLNRLLPSCINNSGFSPEFFDKVISKLPDSDEASSLSAIGSFLDDKKLLGHLSIEHLDKISDFLDNAKTKEFDFRKDKVSIYIKNMQDLKLACHAARFEKTDLSEGSISKIRSVLDNKELQEDTKLGFIDKIFSNKLKETHNPLALAFKEELLGRVLDTNTLSYSDASISNNKFYLAGQMYSTLSGTYKSSKKERVLPVTEKMKQLFEKTQEAGLLKDSDDFLTTTKNGTQKYYYNSCLFDEIEARNNSFFADKKKGTVSIDNLAEHVDEMIGHFKKAKESMQKACNDSLLGSYYGQFEYATSCHFSMEERVLDPQVQKKQDEITKKLQECGNKHFGFSYSKYYKKTDFSQEEFNFKAFYSDKVKESKEFLAKTVENVQDESLQALIKKMQAGKLSSDEFTDLKKKLSIKFHPDKVKGSEQDKEKASTKMQMINAHLDTLKASLSQ